MSAHTPGPWIWVGDDLHSEPAYAVFEAWRRTTDEDGQKYGDRYVVPPDAIVETDSGYYGPRGADRHLIAAAPELLEALKELVETLRREAPGTPLNNHRFDALGAKANAAIAKAEGR